MGWGETKLHLNGKDQKPFIRRDDDTSEGFGWSRCRQFGDGERDGLSAGAAAGANGSGGTSE
jgi:hypothetical protein